MKEKYWAILVCVLIGAGLCFGWIHRHPEDDAFITFRYSKHLAEGIGPVWNADQRVEGYTNFLWMLILAVPIALQWDPVLPATLISMACLALNLWLLFRIACKVTESSTKGFWSWLPLVANATLLITPGSGMETASNGLLWTLAIWQLQTLVRGDSKANPAPFTLLGFTCALALASRPEGFLLFIACAAALVWQFKGKGVRFGVHMGLFMGGFCVLVAPWLIWKLSFYGNLLPNTFYAKTSSASQLFGVKYALIFLVASGCWIPELMIRVLRIRRNRQIEVFGATLTAVAVLYLGYTLAAGGDYLEFRLLVPVIPWVILLPAWHLARSTQKAHLLILASIIMFATNLTWGQANGTLIRISWMDPIIRRTSPDDRFLSHSQQGKALGRLLDHDGSVRFAIGACGAIPYYSDVYAIDPYGLNESHSEYTSYATGYTPGHRRLADFAFLERRKPHLIGIRCDYLPNLSPNRHYSHEFPQIAELLHGIDPIRRKELKIIELPLQKDFVMVCIYFQPHPRIDALINSNSLKIYALE